MNHPEERTIEMYLEDKPGVLNRVVSLFRRRGFNIDALNVRRTAKSGVSRMTVVTPAPRAEAQKLMRQLDKLINVLLVEDITKSTHRQARSA